MEKQDSIVLQGQSRRKSRGLGGRYRTLVSLLLASELVLGRNSSSSCNSSPSPSGPPGNPRPLERRTCGNPKAPKPRKLQAPSPPTHAPTITFVSRRPWESRTLRRHCRITEMQRVSRALINPRSLKSQRKLRAPENSRTLRWKGKLLPGRIFSFDTLIYIFSQGERN